MFGIRPSLRETRRKAALFHSLFPRVLEIAQPGLLRGETLQLMAQYAHCPGLILEPSWNLPTD